MHKQPLLLAADRPPHGMQDGATAEAELVALKKRKLIAPESWKTYRVGQGPKFALQRKKAATDLTAEMIQK